MKMGMRLIWLLALVTAMPFAGFCHPSEALHFQDQAAAFGLYTRSSRPFHDVCKAVNGCDSALPNMFYKRFGIKLSPRDHRYLGHNLLGGAIPKTSIDYLYEKACSAGFQGTRKEFAAILGRMNAEYKNGVVKLAMKTLGLEQKEAESLVHILHDIHLLGDLTPENKVIQTIPKFAEIVHDIRVRAKNLPFKNPAEYAKFIRELDRLLTEAMKVANKDGIQAAVDYFIKGLRSSKILSGAAREGWGVALADGIEGETVGIGLLAKLQKHFPNSKILKKIGSIQEGYDQVVDKAARKMAETAKNNFSRIYTPEELKAAKGVTSTRQVIGTLQEVTLRNGEKRLVLSIPVENYAKGIKAGVSAGVMTFVISEGITAYQFFNGNISEGEFCFETAKNCSASLLTGGLTFVAVTLGATPGGWVVLGIGVGSYMVCDIAFEGLRRCLNGPGFELEDILGKLPTEIQRRATAMDYTGYKSLLKYQGHGSSPLEYEGGESLFDPPKRESPLDYVPNRRGLFDL